MTTQRPHIIIFNPDQWRGDVLGHMGNPAAVTPNLDRLAQTDAVSFRNAFCQNPVCTPSRCSFMSGWYPHVHGHRTMFHMMHDHEPVLLKTLKDAGYYVWWGGKNDLVPGGDADIFKKYCNEKFVPEQPEGTVGPPNDTDWRGKPDSDTYYSFYHGKIETDGKPYWDTDLGYVDGACDFIQNHEPHAGDKPLCLYLPLNAPHPTYRAAEPFYSMIDRSKIPPRIPTPESWDGKPLMLKGIFERQNMHTWTEARWTKLRATYYAMCTWVDHLFGKLVDALKQAGIYDDTAIFFFSDHGDFTGDYGLVEKNQNSFEDCLSRVPFLIKPPASVPVKPRVSNALVELIDFPATVEALCGITPHHTHFGKSLLNVIGGETDTHRDAVFCEGGRLFDEMHTRELESVSQREPTGHYWPRCGLQHMSTAHHTKAVMCRTHEMKYVRRLYEKDELYDLKNDPSERINRIDDPAYRESLIELRDRMLTFFLETGDVVPHDTDLR